MAKKRSGHRASNHKNVVIQLVRDRTTGTYVAAKANDGPTPERMKKQGGFRKVLRGVSRSGVAMAEGYVAIGENPIDYLDERGLLGSGVKRKRRLAAADWALRIYLEAGFNPRVIIRYSEPTSGGTGEISDSRARAMTKYRRMWKQLVLSDALLVVNTCCKYQGLPDNRIQDLCEALDLVARWLRIEGYIAGRLKAWLPPGSRPTWGGGKS